MKRYIEELAQLNKIDWRKYYLALIEDAEPNFGSALNKREQSAHRPRETSHYNLCTISTAMDLSA